MKKLFVLWILTSFALFSSCQKEISTAEQQLAQRKVELDAREQTVDEREKAVAARERAVAAREKLAQAVRAPAFTRPTPAQRQLQTVSPDAAQAEAERNRRIQQLPAEMQAEAQGLIADPSQNADRASKIQERLAQRQRKVEELQRARMAHAVVRPPAEASSPTTSSTSSGAEASGADATSPSPSPTP